MGRSNRLGVIRLPGKLRQIRDAFGFSQTQMAKALTTDKDLVYPSSISLFERGKREPPLRVLLRYSRMANVYIDDLVDDEIDLPKVLPVKKMKH
jgi:transcriptional regulator with XRE-family HTH domain